MAKYMALQLYLLPFVKEELWGIWNDPKKREILYNKMNIENKAQFKRRILMLGIRKINEEIQELGKKE